MKVQVIKRDGKTENVSFDKILNRINSLSDDLPNIDSFKVTKYVISTIVDNIKTSKLDEHAARYCHDNSLEHPDYDKLAVRLVVNNNHKITPKSFSEAMTIAYNDGQLSDEFYRVVIEHKNKFDRVINDEADYNLSYFGFKTLESNKYLLRINKTQVIERFQYLLMRVAIAININDYKRSLETYKFLSEGYFIHATPTLYNSGTKFQQLSSCFLIAMKDDSISGIFDTLKECALISKFSGGIGLHAHNIRSTGEIIKSTNGISNGLSPMLRVFNETAVYVDQGGGKRKGSFAIYLEVWHPDIEEILLQRRPNSATNISDSLFYGMWICDLFMERVLNDDIWSLFDPNTCKGLSDVYSDEFRQLYLSYEDKKMYKKQVKARKIMSDIIASQIESGVPYMLYKDACNVKSNQKNIGTIKSSNLCTEIIQYSDEKETSVCNLASICLPKFVNETEIIVKENTLETTLEFNYKKLEEIVSHVITNLDLLIDNNYYPTESCKNSNFRHRPVGLGVQGLADVYAMLNHTFDSNEADAINRNIFETIYYSAVKTSVEIAKIKGSYKTFEGSPASKGIFQFEFWDVKPSDRYDWESLRSDMINYGIRNSLLVALMPTASTSQIMNNNEAFEPYVYNIGRRHTLAGDFIVMNKHLINDLIGCGLWSRELIEKIIKNDRDGSIQNIEEIPAELRHKYRVAREMKLKDSIIRQAITRAPFIDQSQSMNLYFPIDTADNLKNKIYASHIFTWKSGLKTGSYYIHTGAITKQQTFTCDTCSA